MSIFNNPQLETLDEGAKLYMLGMNPAFYDRLKPKDYDINALMNAPADPTPCIIMAEREFDIDQSLEEYVADFPAHIFGGGQDSFWGMGFEINRAAVMVAKRTRRGMGNRVYYNPDHFQHGLPASLNPVMTPIAADFLPPYTVLVTYEGNNHFDVGSSIVRRVALRETIRTTTTGCWSSSLVRPTWGHFSGERRLSLFASRSSSPGKTSRSSGRLRHRTCCSSRCDHHRS